MSAAAKSTDVIAREARRLAVRALDRANEAVSAVRSTRADLETRIDALEHRIDDGHVRIMTELSAIRESQTFLIQMLTKLAADG